MIGVYSGHDKISLHRGSLIALQEHAMGKYPGMRICFASSADTPFAERVGRASLKMLEVLPGMTIWDLVMRDWNQQDINQIGRQPPLSRYVLGLPNSKELCFNNVGCHGTQKRRMHWLSM